MKAQAEKNGDQGKITLYNSNNTVNSIYYYDLTNETQLDLYADMLVEHIGGGGIKKANANN